MSFMTRRRLTYGDAVKLLGGQSKWASLLGKAAGAGLASVPVVGPALTFLDLRDDVEQAGQSAIAALRGRLTGLSRFKRSELLEATAIMLAVLISPASDMSASTRASLCRELLLRYRPGPKAARTPPNRLRDDIGALASPVRKEPTDEAASCLPRKHQQPHPPQPGGGAHDRGPRMPEGRTRRPTIMKHAVARHSAMSGGHSAWPGHGHAGHELDEPEVWFARSWRPSSCGG
jgi:hypothetical protein